MQPALLAGIRRFVLVANRSNGVVVIILNIIVLAFLIAVSNFTYAQENLTLHRKTLYYMYENKTNYPFTPSNAGIDVGIHPSAIGVDVLAHKIYVANIPPPVRS